MAIITAHKFDGDDTQREYQVGDSILSKSHCRVWVNDEEPDSSTWDLLGSVILFDVAPIVGVENIRIYVSNDGTFPNEYTSPSATEVVESNILDVIAIADNIDAVIELADAMPIIGDIVTENGENTLTNKIMDDASNFIHADATHLKVKATEAILKGKPVKFTGYNLGEDAIEVELADNTVGVSIGIAHDDISNGQFGLIVSNGVVGNLDTSGYTAGQILYLNSSGGLTSTEPTVGMSQPIAFVLKANANNGAIMVNASYPKQDVDDIRYDATTTVKQAIDSKEPADATILKEANTVDTLVSTSTVNPLSANQGKVLKGFIDTINTLLTSDNVNLDELQEVVDYIEANRDTLDTLGISNIAGLQTALDGKVDDSQVLTDVPSGALFTDTVYDDSDVLKDGDVCVQVQAYDVDTTKNDVANIFTAPQRVTVEAKANAIDFSGTGEIEFTATAANITIATMAAKKWLQGTITIHSAENITGWGTEFRFAPDFSEATPTPPETPVGTMKFWFEIIQVNGVDGGTENIIYMAWAA